MNRNMDPYNSPQWNLNTTFLTKSRLSQSYRKGMINRSSFHKLVLNKNAKILDVGCGSGYFLKYFYQHGFKNLYGLDPDKELIGLIPTEIAKVKKGFSQNIEFRNKEFDVVFIYGVLHHLEGLKDYKQTMSEVSRVLKKGGFAFIFEPGSWPIFRVMEYVVKYLGFFSKTFIAFSETMDEERTEQHYFIKNHSVIRDYALRDELKIIIDRYFIYSWIAVFQKE